MPEIVAEVCFYGARPFGFDYLATYTHGLALRFTPKSQPSPLDLRFDGLTVAFVEALEDLRSVGIDRGVVRLFAPGGRRYADHEIGSVCWYGSLAWQEIRVDQTRQLGADEILEAETR